MKVLLQRVSRAAVAVAGEKIGSIERGLLLFVGFAQGDGPEKLPSLAEKVSNLRVFPDNQGRFHLSVKDISGGVLLVPQFTLLADTSKGRRPDFFGAMAPAQAETYFEQFVAAIKATGISPVEQGQFGAAMEVSLVNDGPVTIMLED